ncbi:nucleoside-diphosphate sugar epimerase/dehydratase [Kribbella catacumbae]|uniref:nucleoside-diphosphate sugar epimerase/dehydratase n=1 Tax=Kribbella catacumbae TaxID=460086 RepID=UPI0003A670B2|nr:nucleoside-diphosphate sugar epimerase/dehydratase [Kribbella catacumbae]
MSQPVLLRQDANLLRTIVVGAGEAGLALARDLHRVSSFGLEPVGFLDDDETKQGRRFGGRRVLGTLADLEDVLERNRVDVVVVAIPSMPTHEVKQLGLRAAAQGVTVLHLPPFLSALQRQIAGTDMRALQVGPLIGRSEMHVVSRGAAEAIAGKRVLVTGAGGSIGSELCRQVYGFGPAELIMLDHDESNLHRTQLDLWGEALLDTESTVVADIRDGERIHQLFRDHRPQIVFHAAALKHLPVLERHPCEGVKSNVRGTENLVEAAIAYDVERFVLISTDKAANPTSVLGATKRLAELVLEAHHGSDTVLTAVRFGNVLGSRGSLLHVVRDQLASGSAVTVTHPDVSRFFMTIEEAVGLVLEAARMADGSSTYVLDMGEPVRIVDLVRNFATLLNIRDVQFRYTGLRPGEKLTEELFGCEEQPLPTDHPRISMTLPPHAIQGFRAGLRELYDAASHNRPDEVFRHLRRLVPEYTPAPGLLSAVTMGAPYPDDF